MTQRYDETNVAVAEDGPLVPEATAVGPRTPALRTATRWATKGSLAILDQALISGSNFLVSICLARWLMPEQYGSYALAFSISLLLTFLYQSLLLEPMAVFSGGAYRKSLRGYLGCSAVDSCLADRIWVCSAGHRDGGGLQEGRKQRPSRSVAGRNAGFAVHSSVRAGAARVLHEAGAGTSRRGCTHLLHRGYRGPVRHLQPGTAVALHRVCA